MASVAALANLLAAELMKAKQLAAVRVAAKVLPALHAVLIQAPASTALALAALVLVYAPAGLGDLLAYDRIALLSGQLWRLWSGHLVHFSARHAITDAAALLVIGVVLEPLVGTRRLCIAIGWGAALIALLLLFGVPELAHYRGLSGLDVMMAVMALCALWQHQAIPRYQVVLLAGLLVLKTAAEAYGITPGGSSLPHGIISVWQAHALGALCGMLNALLTHGLSLASRARSGERYSAAVQPDNASDAEPAGVATGRV